MNQSNSRASRMRRKASSNTQFHNDTADPENGLNRIADKPATGPADGPTTGPGGGQRRIMLGRLRILSAGVFLLCLMVIARMAWVQLVWGPDLSSLAAEQRTRIYTDPARRGAITDRSGQQLAYTMQARSLTVSPNVLRRELPYVAKQQLASDENYVQGSEETRNQMIEAKVADIMTEYSEEIPKIIEKARTEKQAAKATKTVTGSTKGLKDAAKKSEVKPEDIVAKLKADSNYEVLVRNVDPDVAAGISEKYYGIAADLQDVRQYPNGAVASNVIGKISQDGQGQFGFESANDSLLSGINGRKSIEVSTDGQAIPGTVTDDVPATNGANVTLTLDLDLQTYVQQQLEQAKANSGAKSASAVVLDAKTAQVMAMATSDSIDPMGDIKKQLEQGKEFGNSTISAPFEPGSVAKIITAAGAIENGVTSPDEVHTVPGSIDMAGVNVKDAWDHGPAQYTTTGIFGKSSNVGTLMLAEKLGEDKFDQLLTGFGVGRATGIELPSESEGLLPQRAQWSGGTFANLPIGQGMSVTLLQMAGIYQTIANGGERIAPRIISEVRDGHGAVVAQPEPERTRVVSEETARTVVNMFRAVTQSDSSGLQQGTGSQAAVKGYQIAGKTGTAQQVDAATGAYSHSKYWITFAGIAPADDPRFVVALMLDNPQRGVHGEGGQSAAPLFHDIASWLLNRDNVPPSPPMEGQLVLQVQ